MSGELDQLRNGNAVLSAPLLRRIRALLRKGTVEPAIGIIDAAIGPGDVSGLACSIEGRGDAAMKPQAEPVSI